MARDVKLQYLLTCDAVAVSPDGKPTFYGVFTEISVNELPCVHPIMYVVWGIRTAKPCTVALHLISPKGKVIASFPTAELQADPGKESIIGGHYGLMSTKFEEPGQYCFRLHVNDYVVGKAPICVKLGEE